LKNEPFAWQWEILDLELTFFFLRGQNFATRTGKMDQSRISFGEIDFIKTLHKRKTFLFLHVWRAI